MNQEKEIEKQGCPICLKGLVPDLESVILILKIGMTILINLIVIAEKNIKI